MIICIIVWCLSYTGTAKKWQKLVELWSTNHRVHLANVYPPKNEHFSCCVGIWNCTRQVALLWAEFLPPKMFPQSHLRRRAASLLALPQNFSYYYCVTVNNPLVLVWYLVLLEDGALIAEIMDTNEPKKLLALQQKITLSAHLTEQWLDSLRRILHESNSAKVCELQLCSNIASNFLLFVCGLSRNNCDYRTNSWFAPGL